MAQEDRGLVLRGLLLLAFIVGLVALVLTILFWRAPAPQPSREIAAEPLLPSLILPGAGPFPSSVSWGALWQAGDSLPSPPGFQVRYNAALSLARRGSDKVPWGLVREMLDEKQQRRNTRVRNADGRDVDDEAQARAFMEAALRAVAAWHEKRAKLELPIPAELRQLYAVVDKLSDSPFGSLKIQADKTRATFFR